MKSYSSFLIDIMGQGYCKPTQNIILKTSNTCSQLFNHNSYIALWYSNSMIFKVWTTYLSLIWKTEVFPPKSHSLIEHYDFKGCQCSTKTVICVFALVIRFSSSQLMNLHVFECCLHLLSLHCCCMLDYISK